MCANCPFLWVSRLQTKIALSTTEDEYITLSQSLQDVIPLITLLKKINKIFPVHVKMPCLCVKCMRTINRVLRWQRRRSLLLTQSTLHLDTTTFAPTSSAARSKFHTVVQLHRKLIFSRSLWLTISSSNYVTCLADGR